jgi:hypothetical protein
MPDSESGPQNKTRTRRRRADTVLVFNSSQKVPDSVLNAIIDEWLVPSLVEQFLRERGVTRQSLLAQYRSLK